MAKQILLVDDSVTIHRVVTLTFANEDYQVTAVKTGDEGLAKARDIKPDIVLADAGMSGKTGYDVCAALRADGTLAATPVLILTGNFAPYDEAKGQKAGADGFVVKPFETQALIDKVADAINKKGSRPSIAASAPAVAAPPVVTAPPSAPTPAPATTPAPPRAIDIEPPAPPARPAPYQSKPAIPAPTPLPTPPAPAPRPPTAPPTARTMMGMQAPVIPPPIVPPKPVAVEPPKPMHVEPLSKPLSVVAQESSAPRAPAPAPPAPMPPTPAPPAPNVSPASSAASAPSSLPREKVPQMPRPSLIPSVPTPSSVAAAAQASGNKPPPPRSTLMGIPTVNPGNLPPGAVALPPSLVKPAAPWGPPAPVPPSAATHAPPVPPPSPSHAVHSPMVAAVTERAVGELAARGPEYEAVAKMSREIIERIAWEVVPELAEVIIREHLDRLVAERQK